MTSSGCSMEGGPSKKGNGTNRTGGGAILKLIWGGNLLYFQGFGDLQPYEFTTKPGNSEFALTAFPGCFRICSGFYSRNSKPYSGHLQIKEAGRA